MLLGIFFTAIGMSLNLGLLISEPQLIVTLTILLIAIKALVLFLLGRWQGLEAGAISTSGVRAVARRRIRIRVAVGRACCGRAGQPAF